MQEIVPNTQGSAQSNFDFRAAHKKPMLACYLPFADPECSPLIADVYNDTGVDFIELGMPCQDPYADGKWVASSMRRAFQAKPTPQQLSQELQRLSRLSGNPKLILMAYQEYLQQNSMINESNVDLIDGLLCLPLKGAQKVDPLIWQTSGSAINRVCFLPTDVSESQAQSAAVSSHYVMLQARPGKTGVGGELIDSSETIPTLKKAGINVPILLGFGISTPQKVRQALEMGADGVVIGSACMEVYRYKGLNGLQQFLESIRSALDE